MVVVQVLCPPRLLSLVREVRAAGQVSQLVYGGTLPRMQLAGPAAAAWKKGVCAVAVSHAAGVKFLSSSPRTDYLAEQTAIVTSRNTCTSHTLRFRDSSFVWKGLLKIALGLFPN